MFLRIQNFVIETKIKMDQFRKQNLIFNIFNNFYKSEI